MPVKSSLPKYYPRPKDIRKQLPLLLPIVLMFIVSVLYASGLRNETVRTVMLYGSLVYPTVIALILLLSIPKLSYYQIDSTGVRVTTMGFIRKRIRWSDIERVGPATIGNVEGVGMMYSSSFDGRVWGRKTRVKIWGWDEILANASAEDGTPFGPEVTKYFKKHLHASNR